MESIISLLLNGIKKYKSYLIFILIVGAGLSAMFLVSLGYYPIAVVNNHFINARTFLKNYEAASIYYQNFLKTYAATSSLNILEPSELERAVLTQLIENSLVEDGASREAGAGLKNLIEEKVDKAASEPGLENAVKVLYGLNLEDFKKEILRPQAERDILTGRLFLKGEKIDDWLKKAKKSSRVIVLSGRFYWNGDDVEMRN